MGISVKSRSRFRGTEAVSLTWKKDHDKVSAACEAFRCTPYYALVVDAEDKIKMFIVSKEHFMKIAPPDRMNMHWGMTCKHLEKYKGDPKIRYVELTVSGESWWNEPRQVKREPKK
ncbi:MAG TPA: hypothetical protein VHA33_07130 [Candidatus Angelobacter sp.]|jgi:hypothetical protein|nr:hypothetical protein [Candidatus Angelobacter sp.]